MKICFNNAIIGSKLKLQKKITRIVITSLIGPTAFAFGNIKADAAIDTSIQNGISSKSTKEEAINQLVLNDKYSGMELSHELEDYIYAQCKFFSRQYGFDADILTKIILAIGNQRGWKDNTFQISSNFTKIYDKFGYSKDDVKTDIYKNADVAIWLTCEILVNNNCKTIDDVFGMYSGWTNWKDNERSVNFKNSCLETLDKYFKNDIENIYKNFNTINEENIIIQKININMNKYDYEFDIENTHEYIINIDCKEKGYSDDVKFVYDEYGEYIEDVSAIIGCSPNLLTAMLTHESHGLVKDNLMQIIFKCHLDKVRTIYNYKEDKYIKYVLTDTPQKYDDDIIVFTRNSIKDPYTNILCGGFILSTCHNEYGRNIFAAVNAYNKGTGSQNSILNKAEISKEDIKNNPSIVNAWMPYDDNLGPNKGDPKYVENVTQYIYESAEDGVYMFTIDKDGYITEDIIYINKTSNKSLLKTK